MITILQANAPGVTLKDRKELHAILRIAYALTETEVWGENYERINFTDYNELIEKGEILVAYDEGKVVGGIHYYERAPNLYCFSLLCADFAESGKGIGRKLVEHVENIAKENDATAVEIEILRPVGMEVPFKIRISDWYKRQGYVYTHSQNFAEVHPVKAKNLIRPCNFDYYRKSLN